MMQNKDGLFFQSQFYVAKLCEPISLIEYVLDDVQPKQQIVQKMPQGLQVSDRQQKMNLPKEKINPSKSNAAHHTQQSKNSKQESTSKGKNWIIKKLKEDKQTQQVVTCLPNLPKPIQNQGKLFSNTASKQIKQRLNKFVVDQKKNQFLLQNEILQGQYSSIYHLNRYKSDSPKQLPIYDVNFNTNFQQFFFWY
ncbi:unnamed protein product (macronuclear) [Paramecium tetraurelia]|uniref:Uncharacterized protein n=1 Tax=Paramecium tetraurelia TaxID=5888 RepID=A0DDB9_PARTE|nr:uncharacterized protein GSPATT00015895001 [Paramecium tetraurelia]CAK81036.1 unnamed protein product [Paramecium tetraurelia]|eukprot:XP_001448433.1 hypothetical protein (macronuclear) [Paramecium tetraurelia strain d4-2]